MKNIEIELYRRGATVYGWCNYLAEDLRDIGILVKSEDGFELVSHQSPNLDSDCLYVIGSKKIYDDEGFMYTYENEAEAIEICNSIKECVDKLNAQEPEKKIDIERVI